jgi:hypothetical protein
MSNTRPGTKGWAVLELLAAAYPDGTTRQAVSNEVGCTIQRVGEVVRGNSDVVVVAESGGYTITPEAWKLLSSGEDAAAATVAAVQTNVIPLRAAEPGQATVNDRLTEALADTELPADLYKRVMADTAAASDEDFESAAAFAKAKKRKRPTR